MKFKPQLHSHAGHVFQGCRSHTWSVAALLDSVALGTQWMLLTHKASYSCHFIIMPWHLHLFYLREVPGRLVLVREKETKRQCSEMCAFPLAIVHSKHNMKGNLGFSITVWHAGMKRCDFPVAESQYSPSVLSPQLSWSCHSLWGHRPQQSTFGEHDLNNKLRKP